MKYNRTDKQLPPLPSPDRTMWQHGRQIDHYTADQMHAYANEALGALADEADAEIRRMTELGLGQRPPNAEREYEPTPMEPFQAGLM
jgi:hypothetical protein